MQYHFYYIDDLAKLDSEFEMFSFCATNTPSKEFENTTKVEINENQTITDRFKVNIFRIIIIVSAVAIAIFIVFLATIVICRLRKTMKIHTVTSTEIVANDANRINYEPKYNEIIRLKRWKIDEKCLAIDFNTIVGTGSEAIVYEGIF